MPLPTEGQMSWADQLNAYLVGAAVDVQAALAVAVAAAQLTVADLINLHGVQGLALDTDGRPYFDPSITSAPTLAVVLDTDGRPYLVGA